MMEAPTDLAESVWADSGLFGSLLDRDQFTDGSARCTKLAVCNDMGVCTRSFRQGERVHFFLEFEVLRDIEVPAAGVELAHETGAVVHGKNTFQIANPVPRRVPRESTLRFHQWMDLWLSPGKYHVTLGLAQCDQDAYEGYVQGPLTHEEFAPKARECCRVLRVASLDVGYSDGGKLSHHGLANLPGGASAHVIDGISSIRAGEEAAAEPASDWPTVLHITHWKAGSQWIYKILQQCAPERIVQPEVGEVQVRYYPIRSGHIYPTVYMQKEELDLVVLPPGSRRFVVIRDLRDTLVSAYFSFKISHPILDQSLFVVRDTLQQLNMEDGMFYLMGRFLENCARIQLSWLESDELVLKYEELLHSDVELLEKALIDHCGLPVNREMLREAIRAHRFEALTGGRSRGQEDVTAHERKGIRGDWRNYFTDRLKKAFNARYGGLLVAAGYEQNLSW
jgi:hypothetical protein